MIFILFPISIPFNHVQYYQENNIKLIKHYKESLKCDPTPLK